MTIAIALSGGVDSACSALLLKRAGHDVIGLHMKLMPGPFDSWTKAQAVASCLDIPVFLVDLTTAFRKSVLDYFVSEYASGRTPSPCPRCNRKIKMTLLMKHALELGADKLATGHYARIAGETGRFRLLKGFDLSKDQSYFLFMLTQDILSRASFPLGEMTKVEVRNMAKSYNMPVNISEESQELCFAPNRMYTDFLLEHGIQPKAGPIVDTSGQTVGTHKGIMYYTVGQRHGLGVCAPEPSYVIRIDANENRLVIGRKDSTFVRGIIINQLSFISGSYPNEHSEFSIKVRSTSREVSCLVERIQDNSIRVLFKTPISGVAPGQAGVLYDGDEVIGGGWIRESLH
ncbi:MAG: tRNA 2-thiouridine(34) synthase MnmA [Desulfomonilaceae bacterium]